MVYALYRQRDDTLDCVGTLYVNVDLCRVFSNHFDSVLYYSQYCLSCDTRRSIARPVHSFANIHTSVFSRYTQVYSLNVYKVYIPYL